MIIGNGNIASVLTDTKDRIYFASGVSNSSENRYSEFQREENLLLSQDHTKILIYFSSLCVYYLNTPYSAHKQRMELLVKTFPRYIIIRLGNITWDTNPHILINYLKAHVDAPIQDADRFLINKEQFLDCIENLPDFNCEINLIGKKLKVKDIVENIRRNII